MVANFVIAALVILLLIQHHLLKRLDRNSKLVVQGLVERVVELQKEQGIENPEEIFLHLSEKLSNKDDVPYVE